ncbi:MAG TPA: pilus assembly protein TadG-related protein [Xanthomonadales bacterium]|nr:pilus assembly protein TadG-related protein [Xanthomonadales bacterium]
MRKRRFHDAERGQVIPIVALALTVLFGAAALAVDVGYWRYQERLQQTAADSAAVAAASEIALGLGSVNAAAAHDATLNGFTDDGVNVRVQTNWPPVSGAYSGNTSGVEVVIRKNQPGFFGKVLGFDTQWISARAVGLVSSYGRFCIYGLSTSGTSVLFNGSVVNTPKCGIISDADMTINGATVTAFSLGYVGSVISNGASYPGNSAQPKKALLTSDPCPTIAGCAWIKAHPPSSGTCLSPTVYNGLSTATLNPGRYCTNVIINGCTNVVFNAGLYEFDAGLTANGVTNVSGSGVTIYNNTGSMIMNGSSVNLSAPTTGNTAGVLFYQNPADTNAFIANGNGGGYAGMIYFPTSQITLNGSLSQWLLVVGSTVTINGSGTSVSSAAFPGWGRSVLAE